MQKLQRNGENSYPGADSLTNILQTTYPLLILNLNYTLKIQIRSTGSMRFKQLIEF